MKIYAKGGKVTFWQSPAAYVIQWGTDSPYWHIECEFYQNKIMGADYWKGVRESTIEAEVKALSKDQYFDVYECIEPLDQAAGINFLTSKKGSHYDRLGVFYLAWLKLNNKRDEANILQKNNDYFCSELASEWLRAMKAVLPDIPKSEIASPRDLAMSRSMNPLYRFTKGPKGEIVKSDIPPLYLSK